MIKRLLYSFAVFVFILVVTFLLGPRTRIELGELPPTEFDEVEAFVEKMESRFDDIIEGTAKTVIWNDPESKEKTEYAIVYLHGFSATLPETRPLADQIAQELGANLFYTRLRGHGRGSDAFSRAKAGEWMADSYEALEIGRNLGDKVILMGGSTGGTLATWLTHHEKGKDIAALILISPNFGPKDPRAKLLTFPWARALLPKIMGETYVWTSPNEKIMKYYTTTYKMDALFEMMALVKYVNGLDIKPFNTPALTLFSPDDQVVEQENTIKFMAKLASENKELHPVTKSGDPKNHLIVGDIWSPENNDEMTEVVVEFIEKLR